jgi:hypothetical protein
LLAAFNSVHTKKNVMKRLLFQKWLIITLCLYHSISPTLQAQFLNPDRRTLENNNICSDPIVGTGVTAPTVLSGISVCVLCGLGGSNVVDGDISNFGGVSLASVGFWEMYLRLFKMVCNTIQRVIVLALSLEITGLCCKQTYLVALKSRRTGMVH